MSHETGVFDKSDLDRVRSHALRGGATSFSCGAAMLEIQCSCGAAGVVPIKTGSSDECHANHTTDGILSVPHVSLDAWHRSLLLLIVGPPDICMTDQYTLHALRS